MDWLFLMQHYGLPTRLLDWSMSPLVALWFALSAPSDGDAAVWCLAADGLNESEAGSKSLFMPGAQPIRRLAMQAFRNDAGPPDTRIVSVLAEEADPRHLVQQAAFTMHGRSEPLESVDGAEKYLVRIRIPSASRAGLKQVLGLYGITRAGLFPDLENLARQLLEMGFSAETSKESPEGTGSGDS